MRFFSSVVLVSCVTLAAANPIIPTSIPLPSPVAPSYELLNHYCESAGPNAYVGVQYANGVITSYDYDQCYPYTVNGSAALVAVFCKRVLCRNCTGENCTNPSPLVITVPRSVALINPGGVATAILGKGSICYKPPFGLPVNPRPSGGPILPLEENEKTE